MQGHAEVNSIDLAGLSALHYAQQQTASDESIEHMHIVKTLLDHKASADLPMVDGTR